MTLTSHIGKVTTLIGGVVDVVLEGVQVAGVMMVVVIVVVIQLVKLVGIVDITHRHGTGRGWARPVIFVGNVPQGARSRETKKWLEWLDFAEIFHIKCIVTDLGPLECRGICPGGSKPIPAIPNSEMRCFREAGSKREAGLNSDFILRRDARSAVLELLVCGEIVFK